MYWGTIHRMILLELIKVFFMALLALTGLIMVAGIISEAMKNGFGPAQILIIIPLLLPSLLPYTVPTTTLFATLYCPSVILPVVGGLLQSKRKL